MGQIIQRVAMGLGVLAAGVLLWLAMVNRTVDPEVFGERIEQRTAELRARFFETTGGPLRSAAKNAPEIAQRLVVARAMGVRILELEKAAEGKGSELDKALAKKREKGLSGSFTPKDRDQILSQLDLRLDQRLDLALGLEEFDRLSPEERGAAMADKDRISKIMGPCEYLALTLWQAADRGDEEGVLASFESMTQLGGDLLRSGDTISELMGARVLSFAYASAQSADLMVGNHRDFAERESNMVKAIRKLLDVVDSPAGRQRLLTALEQSEAQLLSTRELVYLESLRSMEVMGALTRFEHEGESALPRAWLDDVEELIEWQDWTIATVEGPDFKDERGALSRAPGQMGKLPTNVQAVASGIGRAGDVFHDARKVAARVKRWVTDGKVVMLPGDYLNWER